MGHGFGHGQKPKLKPKSQRVIWYDAKHVVWDSDGEWRQLDAEICNMTQQLVELANYFGLVRASGAPAAGDIIGYVLWWGRKRSDCRSRITAAHICTLIRVVQPPARAWRQSCRSSQESCELRGQ